MVRISPGGINAVSYQIPLTRWLSGSNKFTFTLFVSCNAFLLYTSVYAFRKTFAVATFSGESVFGMELKAWLVISQVCGYALSKFVGIKFISELQHKHRFESVAFISFVAIAGWLLFPFVSAPYSLALLFINGLMLGVMWGIVFSYLEGRSVTEALSALLSISFIVSSGLCRTVGSVLIVNYEMSEKWMPAVASAVFILPLVISLYLIDQTPPPTKDDESLRSKRRPMNGQERRQFIFQFLPGIILLIIGYMLLTAFRDFRDNFAAEVWADLNVVGDPAIYTTTEIPIAICVLIVIGSTMFIRNNHRALMINHLIIISGLLLIGIATALFERQLIAPHIWMTLVGLGLYLGYVPFNSIFFERLIAAFKVVGTVGFVMYVADAFGYLGSVGVLFFKHFGARDLSWLQFAKHSSYVVSIVGTLLIFISMTYFHREGKRLSQTALCPNK